MENKLLKLKGILSDMKSVLVAFSGGVDSTFLLKVAVDTLGYDHVLAVTADSETYPSSELEEAKRLAAKIGARHVVISTSELEIPGYKENNKNRCYFCKKGLFEELEPLRKKYGLNHIVYGLIADDLSEYRPGTKAAQESGVRGPLQEAGLYKDEIRALSKQMGLETWDKPSFACLSSRIAYGEMITVQKLSKVEQAEQVIRSLGIRQVRVRHHGDLARIEVEPGDMDTILTNRDHIYNQLEQIGYKFITLDLKGYKSGSMNKVLTK
ncbi:ATP-dependent sacrificial sulfur transferase LarE [Caldalkalibacillus uzonensis]|nr:ATP-dependent sacrificial sulfur transferase LarE [Caldalkalibacillus uzonensis]